MKLRFFLRCEISVHTRGLQTFMAKGHTRYSKLVRGPHVDKQQEILYLSAYIIFYFSVYINK